MRLVVATVPLTGHVQPMLLVVRALVERGHEVCWYAASKFAKRIEASGARFAPMTRAPDWDDADVEAALPALRGARGLTRVRAQLHEMFIAPMRAQHEDLVELVDRYEPDALLADQAHLGAALAAESTSRPWVGLGISALVVPSKDLAPFGTARPPPTNVIDRTVDRFLRWFVNRVLFRSTTRAFHAQRAAAGVPARGGTYFDVISPDLFLQPTIPSFEYPRSDVPPQVKFIGPLVPPAVPTSELPPWWPDVATARDRGRPIVLVTQGTLATDARQLVGPAVRSLAHHDALVIATTPAVPSTVGLEAWPDNTRVAEYVPYQALLKHVSVMITNGGYGGVQMALGHGVPMIVAGGSEEKPEIAARVAWCGAGIDLRTGLPRARQIRAAVTRILATGRYADRARELAAESARYDAPSTAVREIEHLIARRSHLRMEVA